MRISTRIRVCDVTYISEREGVTRRERERVRELEVTKGSALVKRQKITVLILELRWFRSKIRLKKFHQNSSSL